MSPKELEAWLERLHEESFGWAPHCSSGDAARAEDVLQSAYVRVISGRAVFGERSSFRTWLFGVIRRVAQEESRRVKTERQRTVLIDDAAVRAIADETARSPDETDSSRVLRGALEQLPHLAPASTSRIRCAAGSRSLKRRWAPAPYPWTTPS